MAASVFPNALLQHHHFIMYPYSDSNAQYPSLSTGETTGDHPVYPNDMPRMSASNGSSAVTSPTNGATPGGAASNSPGEGKVRLRKACDSCSIRKVKVGSTATLWAPDIYESYVDTSYNELNPLTLGAVSSSVTRTDRLARHVPPLTYHAHSSAQVDDVGHQIATPRPSRDRDSSLPHHHTLHLLHRLQVPYRLLRRSPHFPSSTCSQPSRYALFLSSNCLSTITSSTSIP